MRALSAALAILMVASPVAAKPKGGAAKTEFERGVAAFQKKDFAAARDAFTKSLALEQDVETKYALIQTERLLGNCDASIKLSKELLETETKAANIEALKKTIAECQSASPSKEPAPGKPPAPVEEKPQAPPDPSGSPGPVAGPQPDDRPPEAPEKRSPWWKDPYGDVLTGAGIVALGVSGGFLWSAHKAIGKRDDAQAEYDDIEFKKHQDRADKRGTIGLIAGITGVALVGGGIYRYMTRGGGREEKTAMTGWVTADGGGIAAIGRF